MNYPSDSRVASATLSEEDVSNIAIANRYSNASDSDVESLGAYDSTSTAVCDASKISETNPEPESSYDKMTDDQQLESPFMDDQEKKDYNQLLSKLKKARTLFTMVSVGLAVALLGTVIGLIMVTVFSKKKVSDIDTPDSLYNDVTTPSKSSAKIVDPWFLHQFPSVNSKDSEIAEAFADHSLYQTFYGVTYAGPGANYGTSWVNDARTVKRNTVEYSSYQIQHQISLDMALLSRVTPRVRIVHDDSMLAERVVQSIIDLNLNLGIYLSAKASMWNESEYRIREVINTAPANMFSAVYIEKDAGEEITHNAYKELKEFLHRQNRAADTKIYIVPPQESQANPLELTEKASVAVDWVNTDLYNNLYTNLETPSETSEKARYMTSWVCRVVPNIRNGVEWFWSNAFDDDSQVSNGIFSQDRKLKPAGLPRCN